ncbi:MAG: hypothetical protein ACPGQS_12785, partial [Bradymonadia bacterium]
GSSKYHASLHHDLPHGPPMFSANLDIQDAFSQFVSLLTSIRTNGTLAIYEHDRLNLIAIQDNVVVHHSSRHPNGDPESIQTLFLRLVEPTNGQAEWRPEIAPTTTQTASHSLEHLLLDSLRIHDEQKDACNTFLSHLPLTARLVPTVSEQTHDPVLTRLRTLLGVPPYYVDRLTLETVDPEIIQLINSAINDERLVIKRKEEHTTPPHITASFDVERLDLQNLVARFNHVFRRLAHLCKWEPTELDQQLTVFCQFYGYRDLFDNVRQHADGAIDPIHLIENTVSASGQRVSKQMRLAEALQELLYFELSAVRNIDPKERRALMSTTTQILSTLSTPNTTIVA